MKKSTILSLATAIAVVGHQLSHLQFGMKQQLVRQRHLVLVRL